MHVLVTGHQGYIGSELFPLLLSAGHTVTGVDAGYYRDRSLPHEPGQVQSIHKDIRDLEVIDLESVETVIHLAALSNDPLGDLNQDLTHEINYQASVRLAQLSKAAGVQRFLFSSSCSVYGRAESEALVTEESPVHPLTAYAISKVRTEEELARLADETFCPVFLRNATAYGWSPCFRADLVLNNLACWAYTTGEIRILSDGTPWRPLVHVQDIAVAFLTLLAAPLGRIHNQVINVGAAGQNYRVSELSIFVQQAFPGSRVSYADGGGPDPRSYRVDFAKSADLLPKYQPSWDAWSGAEQLCRAFKGVDLTMDEFTGPRYTRLARLKELIDAGQLDDTLRWVAGREMR
jgi:nucleoside-diphosphate-sugar epimerase